MNRDLQYEQALQHFIPFLAPALNARDGLSSWDTMTIENARAGFSHLATILEQELAERLGDVPTEYGA